MQLADVSAAHGAEIADCIDRFGQTGILIAVDQVPHKIMTVGMVSWSAP
jgi:hypothetical protein